MTSPASNAADSTARSVAAQLTPAGRGAVAVLGLAGPRVPEVLQRCFRGKTPRPLAAIPERRIVYGQWRGVQAESSDSALEDIVLVRFPEHWELSCHGGAIAAQRILEDLSYAGLELVNWQVWQQWTAACRLDASAEIALAQAVSLPTALALQRGAAPTKQRLLQLLRTSSDAQHASLGLQELLQTRRWARHLTEPWRIVLAGPPNAGKSSLLNALLGYERAIVFDQPGTTRVVITALTGYQGWQWQLHDTAGLRETEEQLELLGMARTEAAAAQSDLLLLVLDGAQPSAADEVLRQQYPQALVVWNKSDLDSERQERAPGIAVSARTGAGLEALRQAIHDRLQVPTWSEIGACLWDAALEHDLRTLAAAFAHDPAALASAWDELRSWIEPNQRLGSGG